MDDILIFVAFCRVLFPEDINELELGVWKELGTK